MTFAAAAVIGGAALVGGAMSADAAKSAGRTQAGAANNATQTQLQMFNTVNSQASPYRTAGYNSLADIMHGFGLGQNPTANGQPFSGAIPPSADPQRYQSDPNYRNAFDIFNREHVKQYGTGVPAGTDPGLVAQRVQGYMGYDGPVQQQAEQSGGSTPNDIASGYFAHQFNADDLKSNLAPNYQFQLDQGLGATRNAANLQSGLVSGNTLKGVQDYAQNYAGGAYQNAFNNYTTQQNNIFNRLSTIAGLGNASNQTTANAGTTLAGNAGNAQMAGGAAQAAGTVGAANALTGGASNAASWYALPQIMKMGQQPGMDV